MVEVWILSQMGKQIKVVVGVTQSSVFNLAQRCIAAGIRNAGIVDVKCKRGIIVPENVSPFLMTAIRI